MVVLQQVGKIISDKQELVHVLHIVYFAYVLGLNISLWSHDIFTNIFRRCTVIVKQEARLVIVHGGWKIKLIK